MRELLILRPEPGASATAERARALGMTPLRHPLFVLRPTAWEMPTGEYDGLLLTSANAARHAGALPPLPVHSVGEATATAARAAGAEVASVGEGGVEALLERLPPGLRLLHLAGEERVEAVGSQKVTAITVYHAEPLDLPAASKVEGRVLLIHSPAAGRRVDQISCNRDRVRIAAISPAAAAACGSGWGRIESAVRPSDAALLPLAAELCKDLGP